MQSDPTNDNVFEFQNFEISTGLITLRRIFDGNGIMLHNLNSNKSANFRKMFYDKFCADWMFLPRENEHHMRVMQRKSKDHMIQLHY